MEYLIPIVPLMNDGIKHQAKELSQEARSVVIGFVLPMDPLYTEESREC